MKKIIGVIITALLLVNCSSSDDGNQNRPSKSSKRLVKIVSDDIHQNSSGITTSKTKTTITIKYGSNGFISRMEYIKNRTSGEDGETDNFVQLTTYTYDSSNQLIEVLFKYPSRSRTEVDVKTYTYENGLIVSSVDKSGESIDKLLIDETETYFYTNGLLTEQITKVNDNEHKTVYKHDANGNITKEEGKYNTTTYTYNNKVNPVYAVFPPGFSKIDSYTSKNILIKSVQTQKNNDANKAEITTFTYEYNSDGLPSKSIEKQIDTSNPDELEAIITTTYEYE